MIVFGPVQSRRLGLSLGINHIPRKHCSYACVYCQVGATNPMQITMQSFYDPDEIRAAVEKKIKLVRQGGQQIDTLTFVPDGEPTLDQNLKDSLAVLKPLGIPLAVISNGSLIDRPDVQEALSLADWVSLKVDSVEEPIWSMINRPHGRLQLEQILAGMLDFAQSYQGQLVTETMLVAGLNDGEKTIAKLAKFLNLLKPQTAYIGLPIRPPHESWVKIPDSVVINRVYQQIKAQIDHVELMGGIDPHPFVSGSGFAEELLSTVAVHPLNHATVKQMAAESGEPWETVNRLVQENKLQQINYLGEIYYLLGYE